MTTTREQAFEQLAALRSKYSNDSLAGANEATTRLLLVDEILVLLGWEKQHFNPERKVASYKGYTDYQLGEKDSPRLVVEAKKVGHSFSSPRQVLRKTEYDLTYLQSAFGPSLSEVLEQARTYCEQTRIPYSILTNGAEWIVAQLVPPPGRTVSDLKAFYAGNLLDPESSFEVLWNLAARSSVLQGSLEESFDALNRREFEFSRSPREVLGELSTLGLSASNNAPYLRDFYHYFFDELVDPQRWSMLQHCFVTSARLDQYEAEIKRALEDSAPKFVEGAEELQPGDTQKVVLDRGGDKRGRVVLIVGAVGVGKTTFVTKVMRERAGKGKNILLNLINETEITEKKLWQMISESIVQSHSSLLEYDSLKKAFHRQIELLKKGPKIRLLAGDPALWPAVEAEELDRCMHDPELLVVSLFKMLRSEHVSVAVFLDNVDRLEESHQRTVYSLAHKLSAESGCTTIVPIRETTYLRAKEDGFLDVRTSDAVFHLQAPDVMQVLSRRIKYVERQLDEQDVPTDPRIKEWRRQLDWPQFREAMVDYATELKESLLVDQAGRSKVTLLAAVAWHSVRRLFRVLRHVHGMLHKHRMKWTMSNVISTLIAAEEGFGPQFITTDLFVSPSSKNLAHYLKLRMLLSLRSASPLVGKAGISFEILTRTMRTYGYRRAWIESSAESLVKTRLVECLEIPSGPDAAQAYSVRDDHTYRISALGVLLLSEILKHKVYLAAAGWRVNFLSEDPFNDFVSEARVLRTLVEEDSGSAADLLGTSKLAEIFATYVNDILPDEQIKNTALLSLPEISSIENEIENVLYWWRQEFPELNEELAESPITSTNVGASQMTLPGVQMEREPRITPKPRNLLSARLSGTSELGAQILWVLVDAANNGIQLMTGAEIAERINKLIRGEDRAVLNTNVSRALRGKVLRTQKWLRVNVQAQPVLKQTYGLHSGWEPAWKETFDDTPPELL